MSSGTSRYRFFVSNPLQTIRIASRESRRVVAMAALVGALAVGFLCPAMNAQTSTWTWMGGSATAGQSGVYNTPGSFTAGSVPGARLGAVSWTDASGNLWIFGGSGNDANGNFGFLNDLWEYSTSLNAWAWMGGSSTIPAVNKGQPGVYGSMGVAAEANIPAGRTGAASWTDTNGNFWLFGGAADDTNLAVNSNGNSLNDLWMYSPASGEWTWMGGDSPTNSQAAFEGIYGTNGDFTSGAYPGSLNFPAAVTDETGNFWLFGGYGSDSTGAYGDLNDLWEYKPATNEWAWMSGSAAGESIGSYGTLQTLASGNLPCSREEAVMWADSLGNLWLFGGFGFPPNGEGYLNDLWEFNPTTGFWAWMAGDNTMGVVIPPSGSKNAPGSGWVGIYGTLGVAASGNNPGSRVLSSTWTDSSGNLWLFGGQGFDSVGNNGDLNDLWEFSPATDEWTWTAGSDLADQVGVYQSAPAAPGPAVSGSRATVSSGTEFGVLAEATTNTSSYTPGARVQSSAWKDKNGNLWIMAGSGLDSKGDTGYLNDLWEYQLSNFKIGASSPSLTVQSGGQVTTTLTVTPQNGFSSSVSFACSGLPTGASCSFNPSTVTPSGAAATTKLTITAPRLTANLHRGSRPLFPATVLALSLCILGWKKRRGFQLVLLMAIAAGGLALLSGCGGGGAAGGGGGVTPVTSTITVTATSGSIQQSTTFSLTVE